MNFNCISTTSNTRSPLFILGALKQSLQLLDAVVTDMVAGADESPFRKYATNQLVILNGLVDELELVVSVSEVSNRDTISTIA